MSTRYTPRPNRRMTTEYAAYCNAKARCSCGPEDKNYADYAGRGIKFLFDSFDQFYAELGVKPLPTLMLDRINNNGHYEVGNVRWTTSSESGENKRLTEKRVLHLSRISASGGDVARNSGQAATIAHTRWHVNRGIKKEGCLLCR